MIAGSHNFYIDQGAHFERLIEVNNPDGTPFNFTDYTAAMQIRLEVESETYVVNLTNANGGIVLGGNQGTLTIIMPAATTRTITRDGVYDIEITDNTGKSYRLLKGKIRLSEEVTR